MTQSVSIAMCTHNGARFLQEQLASLANQTTLPAELIVFDDISTDNTIEIIEHFASCAPFKVKIFINEERLFHQRNFVKAAAACSSELIAFCDQDDIWMPDKLARMIALFTSPDIMLAAHQARLIDQNGAEISPRLPDADFAPLYDELNCQLWNFPRGFSQVFRKQINQFAPLHLQTEGFSKDDPFIPHDLWTQIFCNALGKVVWLDITLTSYRQHENNLFGIANAPTIRSNPNKIGDNFDCYVKSSIIYNVLSSAARLPNLNDVQKKLNIAAHHWCRISKIFNFKNIIYTERNLFHRIAAFVCLFRLGAYGSRKKWSLSRKEILRDAILVTFNKMKI